MRKELYKDKHFEFLEDKPFKITGFKPTDGAFVGSDGIVKFKNKVKMYGEIIIEVKEGQSWVTYKASLYHKIDFRVLWNSFKLIGTNKDNEVIGIWTRNHYTNSLMSKFPKMCPKYLTFIGEKGSIDDLPENFRWKTEDDFYLILGNINPKVMDIDYNIFKVR